ncbi:MAG: metallophosphoesterase, partial [Proteobacteria bacterium]|nr:metallophosphoesterase [Pseudomonadota bacterium]
MSRIHSFIKASILFAVLISCGCESDSSVSPLPSENECTDSCQPDSKRCGTDGVEICVKSDEGCPDWQLDSICKSGTHCNEDSLKCEADEEPPKECEVSCEEGSKRCGVDGIEICKKADDECFDWQLDKACEGDTHCNSDKFECVEEKVDPPEECSNLCEENAKQCGEEGVEICKKQENNCLEWEIDKACEEGTLCDADKLDCVTGCAETCEEGKSVRCSDENELEECKPNAGGCAEWSVLKDCGDLACNVEKADCIKDCTPECTKDEKKCDGNGIAACIDPDNDGCTIWDAPVACADNQSCEGAKCIDKCTSDCTKEGATESTLTSVRTCKKTAEGCLKWENTLTCKKGEKLSGGKCVKVCGKNCDPFSIVLLPDPQEYTLFVDDNGKKSPSVKDGLPNPDVFADQLKWISDQRKDKNIKAVIHLGDITDTNYPSAWKLVDNAYKNNFDTKANKDLPYIVGLGNHDFKQCKKNLNTGCTYKRKSNYKTYFNAKRFKDRKWFGGFYKDKKETYTNSYITFNAGGIDFLVISLEYAPRKEAVEWANKLIQDKEAERKKEGKPGYKVIIESHAYISPRTCIKYPNPNSKGVYTKGYSSLDKERIEDFDNNALTGDKMYEQLTSRHNNIILVVNGHHSGSFFRLNKGKAGNVFGELVVDYQSENGYEKMHVKKNGESEKRCGHSHHNGGAGIGFLRMLHFNPEKVTITAKTHSTLGKARFKGGEKRMYCNSEKVKLSDGKEVALYPKEFTIKPDFNIDAAHPSTNYHSFTVTGLDF